MIGTLRQEIKVKGILDLWQEIKVYTDIPVTQGGDQRRSFELYDRSIKGVNPTILEFTAANH